MGIRLFGQTRLFRQKVLGLALLLTCFGLSTISMAAPFSAEKKAELIQECDKEIGIALKIAHENQRWDSRFKVLTFILTVGVTTTSVLIAAKGTRPKRPLSVINAVCAALITASTGFAVTDLGFAAHRRIWQQKADAFANLRDELLYLEPDDQEFMGKLRVARLMAQDPKGDLKQVGL